MGVKPSVLAVCFFSSRGALADNFYTLCRALAPRTRLSILSSEGMRERPIDGAVDACYVDVHKARIGRRLISPSLWSTLWQFSRKEISDLVFFYSEHPLHAVVRHLASARRSLFWCLDPAPHSGSNPGQLALYEMSKRSLMRHSDRVVVACDELRRSVVERYGVSEDRVISCFHGVLDNLSFLDIRNDARDIDILFFGRLEAYKGLDVLFQAVELLRSRGKTPSVRAVGSGSVSLSPPPGVTIENRYVADRELAELVSRSRVVVMPYRDATGTQVPQTAFFYGTPVVASAVGCLPEYVEDGCTGLVVPPGNPQALAAALAQLLEDPVLWASLSRNAREAAENKFANGPLVERLLAAALDNREEGRGRREEDQPFRNDASSQKSSR